MQGDRGIEVKTRENVISADFKGLSELKSHTSDKFKYGIILYSGRDVIPFGENLYAVPFSALWQ